MRTVGIDIGSFSVKVAALETQLKSVSTRSFFEYELNHEPGQDVRLGKIEALKRIAADFDPRSHRYIVGLGSEYSTERLLTFPFVERRKILQSLPFELEDVIPFSQQDAIFDFRIVRQKEASSLVLAVAVPKRYIQELLILCEDAGIDPDIVSLDGTALANIFENSVFPTYEGSSETGEEAAAITIHIGYTKTLVNVIQNQKLLWSRALYFGGKDLSNAISRAYSLPYLEALKGVSEKGFVLTKTEGADKDQVHFSSVISQALTSLVNDVRRTMIDLRAELQIDFKQGYLLGGLSGLINLGPYLTQELEIPINVFHHLGEATKLEIAKSDSVEKASPVAIGLALEGLRKPRSPAINLRKNEFSKQTQRFKLFMERYKDLTKQVAMLFFVFLVYSYLRSSFAQDNYDAVEQAIRTQAKNPSLALTSSQLRPEALKKFVKAKREEIESKKEVARLNKTNSALDVLKTVSSALPSKNQITLDIRDFNIDGAQFRLEGWVNSKTEADSILRNLSGLPSFSKVTLNPSKNPAPPGRYAFVAIMNVTRVPPPDVRKK